MKISDSRFINQTLNQTYRIREKIAEGGCGSIFKAEQLSTGQIVTVKLIKLPQATSNEQKTQLLKQFDKEVKLCALLNHPNIIQLIDKAYFSKYEPYAVFEYIPGETLSHYILRHSCLSSVEMGHIMGQVLHALTYAHENGVAHGDLKPNNIMISRYGDRTYVKVLDFGIGDYICGCISQNKNNYKSGQSTLFVSPRYNAPEQIGGSFPTGKSDLYSWGIIVIECLTGQSVIHGSTLDEIQKKHLCYSDIPIPSFIEEHELGKLLKKVLNKDLTLRLGDAAIVSKIFSELDLTSLRSIKTNRIASQSNFDKTIARKKL